MSSIKSVGPSLARISAEPKASFVGGGNGCIPQKPFPPSFPGKPFPPTLPPPFPGRGDSHARTQGRQLHEIADGVRNGSITAQESEKLLAQQQQLAQATQAANADGKVTLAEQLKLSMMERQADRAIDSAKNNFQRDFFAGSNTNAQRQADQIDRIGFGRQTGNITHSEAGKLLGQQVGIADQRGDADTKLESFMLGQELSQADRDIRNHSRPGTQFGGFDPRPLPIKPRPLPFEPLPLPVHRLGTIAG